MKIRITFRVDDSGRVEGRFVERGKLTVDFEVMCVIFNVGKL